MASSVSLGAAEGSAPAYAASGVAGELLWRALGRQMARVASIQDPHKAAEECLERMYSQLQPGDFIEEMLHGQMLLAHFQLLALADKAGMADATTAEHRAADQVGRRFMNLVKLLQTHRDKRADRAEYAKDWAELPKAAAGSFAEAMEQARKEYQAAEGKKHKGKVQTNKDEEVGGIIPHVEEPSPQPSPVRLTSPKSGVPGEGERGEEEAHEEESSDLEIGEKSSNEQGLPSPKRPYVLSEDGREALAESARRNQAWTASTGPKTRRGKRASRRNATKTGEYSQARWSEEAIARMLREDSELGIE